MRQQQRAAPDPGRRQGGFGAGMTATDDDNIEMFLEPHVL
jgi:hypothetical protein